MKSSTLCLLNKNEHNDWDVGKLSPCNLVDRMWKVHSELTDYKRDMKLLCAKFASWHAVKYSREIDNDQDPELARVDATIEAIKAQFGSVDESVWNVCSVYIDRLDDDDYELPCFFRDKSTPLSTILEEWAKGDGVCVRDFDYYFEEKELNTSEALGIASQGTALDIVIDVIPKECKNIYFWIRPGDEDSPFDGIIYSLEGTDMLAVTMEDYSKDCGVEKASLVFLWEGKKIYGFETVNQLGLSRFDKISVIPADSYKNDRCICCNPAKKGLVLVG